MVELGAERNFSHLCLCSYYEHILIRENFSKLAAKIISKDCIQQWK